MNTRFLGTWGSIFGALFILVAASLQFWHLVNPDPTGHVSGYAAILIVGGIALITLSMACHRIARLEDRVRELERQRESIANGGRG